MAITSNKKKTTTDKGRPLYLRDDEFIKNPFAIVKTLGNFSVAQTNILMTLIANIQERINDAISPSGAGSTQLSLFADEEFIGDKIQFELPLKSLGVKPRDYGDLAEACERLSSVVVPVTKFDEKGKRYHSVQQMIRCWIPDEIHNAKGEALAFKNGSRRTGKLIIEIEHIITNTYFTNRLGYVNQLHKLSRQCKRSKTFPIYSILCRYKEDKMGGGVYEEKYEKVKELLGVLTYKPGTTIVASDTYTKWKDFKRRVLDPSQIELKKLFDEEKSDLYFEYTPIYIDRTERGNPDMIRFQTYFAEEAEAEEIIEEVKAPEVSDDLTLKWQRLLSVLQTVDMEFYSTYAMYCNIFEETSSAIVIQCPTSFVIDKWMEKMPIVGSLLEETFDKPVKFICK